MLELDTAPSPDSRDPVFSRNETIAATQVSPELYARTSKNYGLILRSMGSMGQNTLAAGLGVNESRISHWKDDGSLERTAKMLALLGLKCVPIEAVVYIPFKD